MKSVVISMARGNVVLDENLRDLKSGLQEKNIRVFEASAGTDDSIVGALASGRILITNNTKDFRRLALEYEFGIISTEGATRNAKDLVRAISDAIMQNSLWKQEKPFVFHLSSNQLEILSE